MSTQIKLKNIDYRYNPHQEPVLRDLNLEIASGEMIAIQGPSGSGKSTLLYLMGGFVEIQKGEFFFEEVSVSKLSSDERARFRQERLGFVFQQFHLLPRLTALENILLPSIGREQNSKDTLLRAQKLAQFLGISDRLSFYPNQLSGGQQQRVAIARAMMNEPDILFADEPTGNLDSQSSQQILELFQKLNQNGTTIAIITHDREVARICHKIYSFKDGRIIAQETLRRPLLKTEKKSLQKGSQSVFSKFYFDKTAIFQSLRQNKLRTFLSLLGVSIGVSAVMALLSLGQFSKEKILESYSTLGADTFLIQGYPSWRLTTKDHVPAKFQFFSWEKDLLPLLKVYPEIRFISPVLRGWDYVVSYGGRSITNDVRPVGVSEQAILAMKRELLIGKNFSIFHVRNRTGVCVVGSEVVERLFFKKNPLGEVLHLNQNESSFACRIIGVLKATTTNKDWVKPNLQIFLPFTFFQIASGGGWQNQIRDVLIQIHSSRSKQMDVEKIGQALVGLFKSKYGTSGDFRVDSDSVLIAQMQKFLNLFSILLMAIAIVALTVGGVGITNMMLVSVGERFREIGLRKALGATDAWIKNQFLGEAMVHCILAGAVGLLLGFIFYQSAIFLASQLVSELGFEWYFSLGSILFSLISILSVGLLSGYFPARKAARLQIIDALRAE